MLIRVLTAAALSFAMAGAASAEEPIKTGDGGAPPVTAPPAPAVTQDPNIPEAIGAWARRVIAGQPTDTAMSPGSDPAAARCAPPEDRKPHGEVWGGIGTGGYREVGAVVSQPIGDCGQVTVAVSHTEGRVTRQRGRR